MVRKVGFGRKREAPNTASVQEKSPDVQDRKLGARLIKQLVTLGLIEAVGVAVLVRGILTDNLIPIAIGIAWMALVSLVTLRVVLNFSGKRQKKRSSSQGRWTLEEENSP